MIKTNGKMLSTVAALSLILPVLILCVPGSTANHYNSTRADAPTLNDTTVLADLIMTGDQINFTVIYTDADADVGDVRVKFDDTNETRGITGGGYQVMNFNPSGNSSLGVTYWYLKSFATPGNYTYTFNVTDAEANVTVIENGTSFNVILMVPDEGQLYGWVMSGMGNDSHPVPEADVIIHFYDNETNTTNYYNTTTNATGYYSKTLPIVEEPYFVMVNASGYVNPEKFKLQLLSIDNNIKKNFTLELWEPEVPPDITGELEGFILSTNDPVANASIIVVIFTDTSLIDNITGNITNETVREYNNLTTTSNATGYYLLEGIAPGNWTVVVSAEGFVDFPTTLSFSTELVAKNFTMVPRIILYKITGTIMPPTATGKIGFSQIIVNASSGNFTIDSLMDDNYTLTISADGYATLTRYVIVNGSDLIVGTIYLDKEVNIGPVKDADGKVVAGADIAFTLDGTSYTAITDSLGIAVFEIPYSTNLVSGTEITAEKNGTSMTWSHGEKIPLFGATPAVEQELSTGMIIAAVVVAVFLILIVVVAMVKKS